MVMLCSKIVGIPYDEDGFPMLTEEAKKQQSVIENAGD